MYIFVQFGDRGFSVEAIYSISDQDYDFVNEKTQQAVIES